MLKARHCYANEEAFKTALFREKSDIYAFALNPAARVQIKFLIGNEVTKDLGHENRFFIIDETNRSRAFTIRDAENILNFIAVIRDRRVESYQAAGLVYDISKGKNYTRRYIRMPFGRDNDRVISNDNMAALDIKTDPDYPEKHWDESLNRLEEIVQTFIDICAGKPVITVPWFRQRRNMMLPLQNNHSGPFKAYSLRLNWTNRNEVNNIAFQCGDKTVMFYVPHKENTSTLKEVIEGFIDSLYRLTDRYNAHTDDINMFLDSVPVLLSEDRKHFMEYVGGRGVGGDSHDGSYRTMIVNVNSDASPAWSKTYFHYNHEFLCDLVDGLRMCVDYEI